MSCSAISCWQSKSVLNTSPMAIGVSVCWRTRRSDSCSSPGTGSSSQNSWYGSRATPSCAASRGVRRWCTSWSRSTSQPTACADGGEQLRHTAQVRPAVERLEQREVDLGRLVEQVAAADAVGLVEPGQSRLHAHRLVPASTYRPTASTASSIVAPLAWPYTVTPSRARPPSRLYTGVSRLLPLMSHSAMSMAPIAVIVTGPRRQ